MPIGEIPVGMNKLIRVKLSFRVFILLIFLLLLMHSSRRGLILKIF